MAMAVASSRPVIQWSRPAQGSNSSRLVKQFTMPQQCHSNVTSWCLKYPYHSLSLSDKPGWGGYPHPVQDVLVLIRNLVSATSSDLGFQVALWNLWTRRTLQTLQTRLRCPTQGQEMQGTPLCDGDCSDELRNLRTCWLIVDKVCTYTCTRTCLVIMTSTANINNVFPHTYWICTWGSIEGSWPMQGWHISDTFMMKACCNFPERAPPSQYLRQLVSLATSLRYKSAFLPCRCSRLLPLLGRAAGDARRKIMQISPLPDVCVQVSPPEAYLKDCPCRFGQLQRSSTTFAPPLIRRTAAWWSGLRG